MLNLKPPRRHSYSTFLPVAATAAFRRTPPVSGPTRESVLRVDSRQSAAQGGFDLADPNSSRQGMSLKGGERAYKGRLGKDRSPSRSRRSIVSAEWASRP
jgi:hypothetical protein